MESLNLAALRVWAALAWADGVVDEAEHAMLCRLINASPELTDHERAVARRFLDEPVPLDAEKLRALGARERERIYRAAAQLAAADCNVSGTERTLLARLRQGLGLDQNAR